MRMLGDYLQALYRASTEAADGIHSHSVISQSEQFERAGLLALLAREVSRLPSKQKRPAEVLYILNLNSWYALATPAMNSAEH